MQLAEQVHSIRRDRASADIMREIFSPEAERLEAVNNRLRHLNTVIGNLVHMPGLDVEMTDILCCIIDGIDTCVALSGMEERH